MLTLELVLIYFSRSNFYLLCNENLKLTIAVLSYDPSENDTEKMPVDHSVINSANFIKEFKFDKNQEKLFFGEYLE